MNKAIERKHKLNVNVHHIPRMDRGKHLNDRWRLVRRSWKTRRLYRVSVAMGNVSYHYYRRALNEDAIRSNYPYGFIVKLEEVEE